MAALKEEKNNIIAFDVRQGGKVNNTTKLKTDGTPKKTHSNAKSGRGETWVDPIRDKEDIKKVLDYLQSKIDNEYRADYRKAYARNKMYFCIGVFSGFRVSDLVGARPGTRYKKTVDGKTVYEYPQWTGLKWSDVYCKDGKTFRKNIAIKEIKTGKMKTLYLTETSKRYIQEYVDKYHPDTDSDDYIFVNRKKERLSSKTIEKFIKEAVEACGIEGNYSTHSIRKTFVYQMYMSLCQKMDENFAIGKTMEFTGHRNVSDLLRYLGLRKQDQEKWMQEMENYLDMF